MGDLARNHTYTSTVALVVARSINCGSPLPAPALYVVGSLIPTTDGWHIKRLIWILLGSIISRELNRSMESLVIATVVESCSISAWVKDQTVNDLLVAKSGLIGWVRRICVWFQYGLGAMSGSLWCITASRGLLHSIYIDNSWILNARGMGLTG